MTCRIGIDKNGARSIACSRGRHVPSQHREDTVIVLEGRKYYMRPTFKALMEFEKKAGVTVFEALNDLATRLRAPVRAIAGAFWAGIRAGWDPSDGKPPTFPKVGEMVLRLNMKDCLAKYAEFLIYAITGRRGRRPARPKRSRGVRPGSQGHAAGRSPRPSHVRIKRADIDNLPTRRREQNVDQP